jgi:glycosyltransferase involved in cell wall biosynthesis
MYNGERHLAATVESVLAQSLADFELIIVDDASKDGSVTVARQFQDPRIRLFENDVNIGPAANWDRACALANGKYIKLLCGDDLVYPACLEHQVRAFEAEPRGTSLVASRRDIIDESGRLLLRSRGLHGMSLGVPANVALRMAVRSGTNPFGEPVCVLMRTDLLRRAGRFRPTTQYMMDLDMWCRMLSYGDLYAIDEPLAAFRVQDRSWSHSLGQKQSLYAQAFFFELRRDHPDVISGWDVLRGSLRASSLGVARRTSYRVLDLPIRRVLSRASVAPAVASMP